MSVLTQDRKRCIAEAAWELLKGQAAAGTLGRNDFLKEIIALDPDIDGNADLWPIMDRLRDLAHCEKVRLEGDKNVDAPKTSQVRAAYGYACDLWNLVRIRRLNETRSGHLQAA